MSKGSEFWGLCLGAGAAEREMEHCVMKKQIIAAVLAALCLLTGGVAIALAADGEPAEPSAEELATGVESAEPEEPPVTLADIRAGARITDIDANTPAFDAAAYLMYRGAIYGQGGGRFAPHTAVTRAEAVTALFRLSGEEAPAPTSTITISPSSNPREMLVTIGDVEEIRAAEEERMGEFVTFSDVPKDSWYAEAVTWAHAAGIVTGSVEGSFHPRDPITRAHLAVMLQRYAGHMGLPSEGSGDLSAYTDAGAVYHYAEEPLRYVIGSGLYRTVVADTIHPGLPVSRVQMAQILTGLCAGEDPLAAEIFDRQPSRTVPHAARDSHDAIQEAVEAAAKKYGAIGVQVAVVENGEVSDTFACGWATRNSDPMTADHKMRVASLSKVAVGLAAMALSEEGKVNLDESIGKYWGFEVKNPQYPDKPVSLRTLLTHTSSIFNAGDSESRSYESVKSRLRGSGFSGGVPGSIGYWNYNNYAYGVLGMTLELASGEYVDEILNRRLFDTMGIDGAFAAGTIRDKTRMATLYYNGGAVSRTADTQRRMGRWAFPGATGTYFAGGLTISARDIGKLVGLMASDGRYEGVQLLKAETVAVMESYDPTPVPGGSYQAQPMRRWPELYGRQDVYFHTGSAYGVFNCMSYDPNTGDGVVVLTVGASGARDEYGIYSICSEINQVIYEKIA